VNYKGRVILVTGAASGIGREIAEGYLKENATVIIADKNATLGLEFEKHCLKRGFDAQFIHVDLKDENEIVQMFQIIKKKYSHLDVLINNAGVCKFKPLKSLSVVEWDEVINTNLRATFIASREFSKINDGLIYGRIINISSTRYLMSESNSEAYAASKGGIVSLTHALAISLSSQNMTVNSISPGWIHTGSEKSLSKLDHQQHPSQRVGKPTDILKACLYLTDEKNNFITGTNIIIDGGITKKMIYLEE